MFSDEDYVIVSGLKRSPSLPKDLSSLVEPNKGNKGSEAFKSFVMEAMRKNNFSSTITPIPRIASDNGLHDEPTLENYRAEFGHAYKP